MKNNLLRIRIIGIALTLSACNSIISRVRTSGGDLKPTTTSQSKFSITQHGITWNFDRAYTSGQFVNGDWWVVGPVTITSVTPGWDGEKHGSMLDPIPLAPQGWDQRINELYAYSDANRVRFPVTLTGVKSLISAICLEQRQIGGAYVALDKVAVLTVVNEPVPDGTFRPPFAAGSKPLWNISQVRYRLLPSLAPPPGALPQVENKLTMAQTLIGPKVSGTTTLPASGMEPYPAFNAIDIGEISLMALIRTPNQREYAHRLIQAGIDKYSIALRNEDAFRAYGGFGSGHLWQILFAGIMLGDPGMQQPPKFVSPGSTIYKFGENGHTYYGQPTARHPLGTHWGWNCHENGYTYPFFGNHDCRDPNRILEPEEMPDGGGYRAFSLAWTGYALAARLMNAQAIWDHPAFFTYVDEFVSEGPIANIGGGNWNVYGTPFVRTMWETYR